MLAKSIVALFIISVISLTASLSPRGLGSLARDKHRELTLALMDKKIVAWYASHGGELPDAVNNTLSAAQLESMGASFLELQDITYTKEADNVFSLNAILEDGTVISSVNSGRPLLGIAKESL